MTNGDQTIPTILIVEDDTVLAEEVSATLRYYGMNPVVASAWPQVASLITTLSPAAILLDQRLGLVDTLPFLPRIRTLTSVPVLVLTGNPLEADRILALETGADDFLLKPVSGRELVARIRAHLRRGPWKTGPDENTDTAPAANEPHWAFSLSERRLMRPDGTEVALTASEFELLAALLESDHQIVGRDTLTRRVLRRPWRTEDRAIDNLVLHLRQKLGPGGERAIATVRNLGYVFTYFPKP